MCEAQLRRLGASSIHIAAPPLTRNGVDTKGVDDFLADKSGGRLVDLVVIDNEPPAALERFIAQNISVHGVRRDRADRDEQALRALITYSATTGEVAGALRTLAHLMGMGHMRAWRALRSLRTLGAFEAEGDILDVEPKLNLPWSRGRVWKLPPIPDLSDWSHPRPVLTLAPDLCPVRKPERRLGDVIAAHPLGGNLQWMTENYSTVSAA